MTAAPLPISAGSGTWKAFLVGDDTPVSQSVALVHALFESPHVRVLDTSNNYGLGESERRIGLAIREYGGVPDDFLIVTKADRDMDTGRFDGARMRRSLEESRERLGLEHLPLVYLHDPENTDTDAAMAPDGPVAALIAAHDEGLIGELGVAGGRVDLMEWYVRTGLFSALITHNRYTLVDRSADRLIGVAHDLGMHVTNASPYGGGLLTAWPPPVERYAYGPVRPGIRASAEEAARLADEFGVPLAAAALSFSLSDPRIDRTIVGMRSVSDLDATAALAAVPVPDALAGALRALPQHPEQWQDPPR